MENFASRVMKGLFAQSLEIPSPIHVPTPDDLRKAIEEIGKADSEAVRDCVSKKIPILLGEGKYEKRQAIAIAFSVCRERHEKAGKEDSGAWLASGCEACGGGRIDIDALKHIASAAETAFGQARDGVVSARSASSPGEAAVLAADLQVVAHDVSKIIGDAEDLLGSPVSGIPDMLRKATNGLDAASSAITDGRETEARDRLIGAAQDLWSSTCALRGYLDVLHGVGGVMAASVAKAGLVRMPNQGQGGDEGGFEPVGGWHLDDPQQGMKRHMSQGDPDKMRIDHEKNRRMLRAVGFIVTREGIEPIRNGYRHVSEWASQDGQRLAMRHTQQIRQDDSGLARFGAVEIVLVLVPQGGQIDPAQAAQLAQQAAAQQGAQGAQGGGQQQAGQDQAIAAPPPEAKSAIVDMLSKDWMGWDATIERAAKNGAKGKAVRRGSSALPAGSRKFTGAEAKVRERLADIAEKLQSQGFTKVQDREVLGVLVCEYHHADGRRAVIMAVPGKPGKATMVVSEGREKSLDGVLDSPEAVVDALASAEGEIMLGDPTFSLTAALSPFGFARSLPGGIAAPNPPSTRPL